jgi:hypothetical protein
MNASDIAGQLADLDQQTVEYNGSTFTIAQLREAFRRALSPVQHWKEPIRALVQEGERDLMVAAVEFHVGGPTTVEPRTFNRGGEQVTLLVLENQGYYANIGA